MQLSKYLLNIDTWTENATIYIYLKPDTLDGLKTLDIKVILIKMGTIH